MKRRSTSMKFDLVGRIIFSSNYCHWSILDKRAISMSLTWMKQLINQRMCFDLLICNFTCIEIFDIGELWLGGSCADDVTKMKFHRWRTVTGFSKIFNITFIKQPVKLLSLIDYGQKSGFLCFESDSDCYVVDVKETVNQLTRAISFTHHKRIVTGSFHEIANQLFTSGRYSFVV